MSRFAFSPVTFEIARPHNFVQPDSELAQLPIGTVSAIEATGHGRFQPRVWGGAVMKATTYLPDAVAGNVFEFIENMSRPKKLPYNCLSFAEQAQGRPHDIVAVLRGTPPMPPENTYEPVSDVAHLEPGESYGLLDSEGGLIHAIVGLEETNRHLDMFGRRGQLRLAETPDTMQHYRSNQLVRITDSYL